MRRRNVASRSQRCTAEHPTASVCLETPWATDSLPSAAIMILVTAQMLTGVVSVFVVPQSHSDMVSQLLSPSEPKNWGDALVLGVLGIHILLLYILPAAWRIPTFAVIYLTWRASYNLGIGLLLLMQSKHTQLVTWAKRSRIFVDPKSGKNPYPGLYSFMKREMEVKIPKNYSFDTAPIEYNTWLLFRRFVDIILMCDFVSYCLFAMANGSTPASESAPMTVLRWGLGCLLFGFNLWVKLDAHRVVKDYAWYWGDFFFLVDQELTFDGVFEMAPHPMYSVGYAGYYGISLMAASYNVLIISIVAHAAQFAFLTWVENPHIEKIYNPPPPRKRQAEASTEDAQVDGIHADAAQAPHASPTGSTPSQTHNLIGLKNLDLCRVTDISVVLLLLYVSTLTFCTPSTPFYQSVFVLHALVWRLWYTIGIGSILQSQSARKTWFRHFVKFGESREEAWRQWKGVYHLSLVMAYASFVAAVWKSYEPPSDWNSRLVLLKHILGAGLVALQMWTSASIYDSLGEFGWFFGDFFFDKAPKLTYGGIYRYLNNPERIIGLAGLWGAALITSSGAICFLALTSHLLSLGFIQFVERPHMERLYGRTLRKESGLTKSLRRTLPPRFQQWPGSVDKILEDTFDFVEDFIGTAKPRLANGVQILVRDSTALLEQPSRIVITRLEPDLAGYDPKDYSLEVVGSSLEKPVQFAYGEPIRVKWTAPLNHTKRDWVGVYMVAHNSSRDTTRVSSAGRWVPTNREQFDLPTADSGIVRGIMRVSGATRVDGESQDYLSGEMEFSGDKLWWTTGVFEFRYHHNGKHNVMAISRPFEIRIPRFDEEADANPQQHVCEATERALLPIVRNCFDCDPEIAPNGAGESFGNLEMRDGKYARRVVYAVLQMSVLGNHGHHTRAFS